MYRHGWLDSQSIVCPEATKDCSGCPEVVRCACRAHLQCTVCKFVCRTRSTFTLLVRMLYIHFLGCSVVQRRQLVAHKSHAPEVSCCSLEKSKKCSCEKWSLLLRYLASWRRRLATSTSDTFESLRCVKTRPRQPFGDGPFTCQLRLTAPTNYRCRHGVTAEAAARLGGEWERLADSAASLAACRVFFDLSDMEYAKAREIPLQI